MMKKQYHISESHQFKRTVEVYHDGELISSERLWIDEADKYTDLLERDGYIRGYSQKEVDEVKRQYEEKLDNLIGGKNDD